VTPHRELTGSANLGDAGDARPVYDPLADLSHRPLMDRPGLYVYGGISPYSIELLKPVDALLKYRGESEDLLAYMTRIRRTKPKLLDDLAVSGLAHFVDPPPSGTGSGRPPTAGPIAFAVNRLAGVAALLGFTLPLGTLWGALIRRLHSA
jgi:hypothetical protein